MKMDLNLTSPSDGFSCMQFSTNVRNRICSFYRFFGDYEAVVLPDPIPNSAVKHRIADGSAGRACARVGCRQIINPNFGWGFFVSGTAYGAERESKGSTLFGGRRKSNQAFRRFAMGVPVALALHRQERDHMNIERFWRVIESGVGAPDSSETVSRELDKLTPEELVSFQRHFDCLVDSAYTWELWGAAYTIEGGCGDDGFIDFRYGLIARGKSFYEKAVKSPDSLADLLEDDWVSNELFGYLAIKAYERKTGERMPREKFEAFSPTGEDWEFEDEEETKQRLPRLWAKFGQTE